MEDLENKLVRFVVYDGNDTSDYHVWEIKLTAKTKLLDNEFGMFVYPNPAGDIFIIKAVSKDKEDLLLRVTDLNGKIKLEYNNPGGKSPLFLEIETRQRGSGLYFVTIYTGKTMIA